MRFWSFWPQNSFPVEQKVQSKVSQLTPWQNDLHSPFHHFTVTQDIYSQLQLICFVSVLDMLASLILSVLTDRILTDKFPKSCSHSHIFCDSELSAFKFRQTEVVLFGPEHFREKLSSYIVTLDGISLASSSTVRNLGDFFLPEFIIGRTSKTGF